LLAYIADRADEARRTGATRPVVDELLVLLLLDAGLRAREVSALTIGDVLAGDGLAGLRVRRADGATERMVEVPQHVGRALARFIRFHRPAARSTEPLLLSERRTRLGYMSLYSKIRRLGREAGVTNLSPGTLRFAFLRRLYEREQDLRYVQEQAGHACLKTTARYIKALRRSTPDAATLNSPPGVAGPQHAGASQSSSGDGRHNADSPCATCGRPVPAGQSARIDSGQRLCPSCLRDLRRRR
jgi:integrase